MTVACAFPRVPGRCVTPDRYVCPAGRQSRSYLDGMMRRTWSRLLKAWTEEGARGSSVENASPNRLRRRAWRGQIGMAMQVRAAALTGA